MENQEVTTMLILDLSAAFDMVDHSILLKILHNLYSLSDQALKWVDLYLQPRWFRVCIDGNYSTPMELWFGVPQGSCSGANLFSCYCSQISSCIPPQLNINGFADDHSIRQQHKPTSEMCSQVSTTMQTTLMSIKDWMDSMHLKLNTDKTDFMIFGSKHQLRKLDESTLGANGELIKKGEVVRYLGRHLDASPTFETHIKSKVKTAMANFIKIRSI